MVYLHVNIFCALHCRKNISKLYFCIQSHALIWYKFSKTLSYYWHHYSFKVKHKYIYSVPVLISYEYSIAYFLLLQRTGIFASIYNAPSIITVSFHIFCTTSVMPVSMHPNPTQTMEINTLPNSHDKGPNRNCGPRHNRRNARRLAFRVQLV